MIEKKKKKRKKKDSPPPPPPPQGHKIYWVGTFFVGSVGLPETIINFF